MLGAFFQGGRFLFSSASLCSSALIVALRQKSRPQESAAQTFEAEAILASKPALNFAKFEFLVLHFIFAFILCF